MSKSRVSCLMLTIDRFEITPKVWETNMKNAGTSFEIEGLVCDNGSTDRRIVDYFAKKNLKYHRVNSKNEGVGKAFNQLFLRSTGDYICLMGNDIELPPGWMDEMVKYAEGVPYSGIIGISWHHSGTPPITTKHGIHARWLTPTLNRVFGVWLMRREVIEKLGLFYEGFDVYGLEDSSFNEKVNRAGFNSCYVPLLMSNHVGHDVGEQSAYRKMKDESLSKNLAIFHQRLVEFEQGKINDPLPPERNPL